MIEDVPTRPDGALKGSEFVATLPEAAKADDRGPREAEMLEELLLRSNLPPFMRRLVPIECGDEDTQICIYVMPDYLCVGDDDDYVRLPLQPCTAQVVFDAWGFVMPTKKIVDIVWKAAKVKLAPVAKPDPGGRRMMGTKWFVEHNETIQKQLASEKDFCLGDLVAGHKKDLVVVPTTSIDPRHQAIYGWHQKDGTPIQGPQPQSTFHELTYQDYSAGIRAVGNFCTLNWNEVPIVDVLSDSKLCKYLSDVGPISSLEYPKHP